MLKYNPLQSLPTAEELPETDHKPVDSQLQILIASLLDDILTCGMLIGKKTVQLYRERSHQV